jgi:hypothetical protein
LRVTLREGGETLRLMKCVTILSYEQDIFYPSKKIESESLQHFLISFRDMSKDLTFVLHLLLL